MGIKNKKQLELITKMMSAYKIGNNNASESDLGKVFDELYDMKVPILESRYKGYLIKKANKKHKV